MFQLLATLPDKDFINAVGRGLTLIFEHVAHLQRSIVTLAEVKQPRGVAAVRALADEEAAKYLILVDAIRCARKDQKERTEQLKLCRRHLAKGIYAEVTWMSPADLAELRRIIDGMRQSHYLDGPMDVDWIFRNEVEERRERTLYVDYVNSDEGAMWLAPDVHDDRLFLHEDPTAVVRLVIAMTHAGIATPEGLGAVAEIWRGFVPEEDTHWQEIRKRNHKTLRLLEERGLLTGDFTDQDAVSFVDEWTFPLHHEDLSMITVDPQDLREKQRQWTPDHW